jgi:hypothetical protein
MCVAKKSMDSEIICSKLKLYCDPLVQANILDMSQTICSDDYWKSKQCCYAGDNGVGCDRDLLLAASY